MRKAIFSLFTLFMTFPLWFFFASEKFAFIIRCLPKHKLLRLSCELWLRLDGEDDKSIFGITVSVDYENYFISRFQRVTFVMDLLYKRIANHRSLFHVKHSPSRQIFNDARGWICFYSRLEFCARLQLKSQHTMTNFAVWK